MSDTVSKQPLASTSATGAVTAAQLGKLLVVQGTLVKDVLDDRPYGWKIFIDDGSGTLLVFVDAKTDIDVTHLQQGQRLKITGVVGTYEKHVELLPRTTHDIVVVPRMLD